MATFNLGEMDIGQLNRLLDSITYEEERLEREWQIEETRLEAELAALKANGDILEDEAKAHKIDDEIE